MANSGTTILPIWKLGVANNNPIILLAICHYYILILVVFCFIAFFFNIQLPLLVIVFTSKCSGIYVFLVTIYHNNASILAVFTGTFWDSAIVETCMLKIQFQ